MSCIPKVQTLTYFLPLLSIYHRCLCKLQRLINGKNTNAKAILAVDDR